MTAIRFYNRDTHDLDTFDVKFTKRSYGGWNIGRADNGRVLGWIYRSETTDPWGVYVSSGAFRGAGPDDEGDLLDAVPCHLHHGDDTVTSRAFTKAEVREDAAASLIEDLRHNRAPAVGFDRHPQVRRWADR